jgi:hypothetical protein
VSYKPSADEAASLPGLDEFRSRRKAVSRFLQEKDLIGLLLDEARQAVEAAGFRFRFVNLDVPGPHVLTADMASDRVTATVKNGRVMKAEPN